MKEGEPPQVSNNERRVYHPSWFQVTSHFLVENVKAWLPRKPTKINIATTSLVLAALDPQPAIIQYVKVSESPVVLQQIQSEALEMKDPPTTRPIRQLVNCEVGGFLTDVITDNNWYKLLGTGMKVEQEAKGAVNRFEAGKKEGKSIEQASKQAIAEVKGNIFGFIDEYLKRRHVLTTNYKLLADGRIAHADSDVALLDVISKQERMGKVWEAFSEIEKFVKRAPVGSMAFYTSPPGISGMKEKDGKDHKYFDSQTFTVQVIGINQFRVITFVSDMSVEQNLKFLEVFGENVEDIKKIQDPYKMQSEIAGRVVKIEARDDLRPDIRQILGKIKNIIGSDVIRTYETEDKNGFKTLHRQTYAQALKKIAEIETNEYQIKDQKVLLEVEGMSKLLKQVLESEGENQQELLERVIGEVVLRIKRLLEGKILAPVSSLPTGSFDVLAYFRRQDNEMAKFYKEDIRQVRAMAGCAGGGLSLSFGSTFLASSSLGFSSSTQESSESSSAGVSKFTEKKHCAICNHYNPCMQSCEKCGGKVN